MCSLCLLVFSDGASYLGVIFLFQNVFVFDSICRWINGLVLVVLGDIVFGLFFRDCWGIVV